MCVRECVCVCIYLCVCVFACVRLRVRVGARGGHALSVGEQQREASSRGRSLLFSEPGRAGSYILSLVDFFFSGRLAAAFRP